jgi:hypothetical protein
MTKNNTHTTASGVQLDLLNGERLQNARTNEKIRMILDSVREGNIVILSTGLTAEEEGKLVERTMSLIQPGGFSGIEIDSYQSHEPQSTGLFNKVFSKKPAKEDKLTVIGPADKLQTLHKDENLLSALVKND